MFKSPCERCGGPTTPPPPARYFDGMSTEFPELGGHFPGPFVSLAIRPLSEALWMFPASDGGPRIDHAGILAFEAFHGLDAEDSPVYLEIIRAGVHAYNDGRRRGYAQRARRRREKLRA